MEGCFGFSATWTMISDHTILAVVTAKSLDEDAYDLLTQPLLGKPLLIWSIKAAIRSRYVDTTFVGTNCPRIKTFCEQWIETHPDYKNVQVILYPQELAMDTSRSEEALIYAVQMYESQYDKSPDLIVDLQAKYPVRKKSLLDDAIERLDDSESKSLVSVCEIEPYLVQIKDGVLSWLYDRKKPKPKLTEADYFYQENGCLHITSLDLLMDDMCFMDENPFLYINDPISSFKVNSDEDFLILKNIVKELDKRNEYITDLSVVPSACV